MIKNKNKYYILTLLWIFFTIAVYGGNKYSLVVEVSNKNPAENEQITIKYTLRYSGNSLSMTGNMRITKPDFSDFVILDEGGGMNMNFSFGSKYMDVYNYTFIIKPKKTGTFIIKPLQLSWGKNIVKSKPVTITVVKADPRNLRNENRNVFIELTTSKKNVYVNEQLTVTATLYTRLDLSGMEMINAPDYKGFVKDELEVNGQKIVTIGNQEFVKNEFEKFLLTPIETGTLTIPAYEVKANQVTRRTFFRTYTKPIMLTSNRLKIQVTSLPEKNKPVDFSGATGVFNINSSVDKTTLKENDAITYKIEISGTGNLTFLDDLNLDFPPDFEVYDPKIKDNLKTTENGISGKRVFEYLIIPRHAGTFTLPEYSFNYFDTKTGKYMVKTTDIHTISVEKGQGNNHNTTQVTNVNKEDVKYIGKDIRYIKTTPIQLYSNQYYFYNSIKFYLIIFAITLIFILLLIWIIKNNKAQNNIEKIKFKKANSVAQKRLKLAKKLMAEAETEKFYEEISKAISKYLSNKLNIPLANMTMENINNALKKHNISENIMQTLENITNTCDMARFSPTQSNDDMQNLYQQAVNVINNIQKQIK